MTDREQNRRAFARPVLGLLLMSALLQGCAGSEPEAVVTDPLESRGHRVTGGAAPGYVEDIVCQTCHGEIWDSYQEVGMSRSFYRPRPQEFVEDLEAEPLFHEPSGRYYEMRRQGDELIFRRFQLAHDGERINLFEIGVDWILGSGNHNRSYLYQTELGELFQLPIGWYSQSEEWGMSPGFELEDHFGVRRRVRQECMFCHNAYPEVPEGSDLNTGTHLFPKELPQGTGCQRCHGPGAEHSRKAFRKEKELEAIRATIVNPGKLAPQLRDDICYGCHMQPSVVLTSVGRFDRGAYSFRPGQSLADYKVALDPVLHGEESAERFEINHHPYRLEQSRCFNESQGTLSCLTCHDPHRKVRPAERAEHYRTACAGCHEFDAESFVMAHASIPQATESDCTGCHMPERRTQDVVLVTMTDHNIRRDPGGAELVAPIEKKADPRFVGVDLVYPERGPDGLEAAVYRAVATLRTDANAVAVDFLVGALPQIDYEEAAWLDLAQGQLSLGRGADAIRTLQRVLAEDPHHALAHESLGVARLLTHEREAAVEHLRRAVELNPRRPEAHYNLGVALVDEETETALNSLGEAIELRPNYAEAWFYSGRALSSLGRLGEAERHYRRLLELEPSHARGHAAIAEILEALGRGDEARRFLGVSPAAEIR